MYPKGPNDVGLLRLHSSYQHDLKIYSADEGRVQMTAAAFARGMLDLEGDLTPILVSLVKKGKAINDYLLGVYDAEHDVCMCAVCMYMVTLTYVAAGAHRRRAEHSIQQPS